MLSDVPNQGLGHYNCTSVVVNLSVFFPLMVGNYIEQNEFYRDTAQVVGWAWGANIHGHGQSVNSLFPLNVSVGLGTNFVARDVLRATSIDDAVARATVSGQGNGAHFNLGNFHRPHQQVQI